MNWIIFCRWMVPLLFCFFYWCIQVALSDWPAVSVGGSGLGLVPSSVCCSWLGGAVALWTRHAAACTVARLDGLLNVSVTSQGHSWLSESRAELGDSPMWIGRLWTGCLNVLLGDGGLRVVTPREHCGARSRQHCHCCGPRAWRSSGPTANSSAVSIFCSA